MTTTYDYPTILADSERIDWTVDDLIGGDRRLDFSRPFLPESLARTAPLDFLSADERLALNQIRGHGYLCTFGLVEEFVLPFVLDHARPDLASDDHRTRALLTMAEEEAKHIHLFKRFRAAFEEGFGSRCEVIGPPEAVAAEVLRNPPLAVALAILHIEWMTQRHFTDSVRDAQDLDPQFRSLLRHHWMEEAQHAKIDTLMVEALAAPLDTAARVACFEGYLQIGAFLDGGLRQQVEFDREALERATGRKLTAAERARFVEVQQGAQRWTYLGSGMTHPSVLATLDRILPEARSRLETVAAAFR